MADSVFKGAEKVEKKARRNLKKGGEAIDNALKGAGKSIDNTFKRAGKRTSRLFQGK